MCLMQRGEPTMAPFSYSSQWRVHIWSLAFHGETQDLVGQFSIPALLPYSSAGLKRRGGGPLVHLPPLTERHKNDRIDEEVLS